MNSKAQRIANRFKICDKKSFVLDPTAHLVERFAIGIKQTWNKILILLEVD